LHVIVTLVLILFIVVLSDVFYCFYDLSDHHDCRLVASSLLSLDSSFAKQQTIDCRIISNVNGDDIK
jgi:hypothetical protein